MNKFIFLFLILIFYQNVHADPVIVEYDIPSVLLKAGTYSVSILIERNSAMDSISYQISAPILDIKTVSNSTMDRLLITYDTGAVSPNEILYLSWINNENLQGGQLTVGNANYQIYPSIINVALPFNSNILKFKRNDMSLGTPEDNFIFIYINNFNLVSGQPSVQCNDSTYVYLCNLQQDIYHPNIFKITWKINFTDVYTGNLSTIQFNVLQFQPTPGVVSLNTSLSRGTVEPSPASTFYKHDFLDQQVVAVVDNYDLSNSSLDYLRVSPGGNFRYSNFYPVFGSPGTHTSAISTLTFPIEIGSPSPKTNSFDTYYYNGQTGGIVTTNSFKSSTYQEPNINPTGNMISIAGNMFMVLDVSLTNITTMKMNSYYYQKTIPPFPYGIGRTNGTASSFNYQFSFANLVPILTKDMSPYFIFKNNYTIPGISYDAHNDSIPPAIVSISITPIGRMKGILSVHATDVGNGIGIISLPPYKLSASNLVSGNKSDGIYETVIDYSIESFNFKTTDVVYSVTDLSMNEYVIDPLLTIFNQPKVSDDYQFNPFDLISIKFKYNNIDLSASGKLNTVYLNYKGADPNHSPFFIPLINRGRDSFNNLYSQPDKYRMTWDNIQKVFTYDFELPAMLYTKSIDYNIYFKPHQFTVQSLYTLLGPSVLLNVTSRTADEMPPLIRDYYFDPPGQINVTLSTAEIPLFFKFNLYDSSVPIKSGIISVTSPIDPVGFTFPLPPISNDGYYKINIPITSETVSQNYTITRMDLIDNSGHMSSLQNGFINPFYMTFNDVQYDTKRSIKIIGVPPSNQAIYLKSFTLSEPSFKCNIYNSSFKISFETNAQFGIKTDVLPVIYIESLYGDTFSIQASLLGSPVSNSAYYETEIFLPFRFGYQSTSLLVSIYGVVDKYMNMQGFNGYEIANDYVLLGVDSTSVGSPFISTTSAITSKGGKLSVFGYNYASFITKINYFDGRGEIDAGPVNIVSNSMAIIDSIEPTLTPFSIQFINGTLFSNVYTVTPIVLVELTTAPPVVCLGTPPCGGTDKGQCIENVGCQCIYPWTGKDCLSRYVNTSIPEPDPNDPNTSNNYTTNLPNGNSVTYTSFISVVGLVEYNYKDELVNNHSLSNWIFKDESDNNTKLYTYKTNFTSPSSPSQIVFINVSIQWFEKFETIEFANQQIDMNPSTMKYKISISQYPFTSYLNKLQLVMSSKIESSNTDDGCSVKEFNTESSDFEYMKLQIDDHSLYGRFIKRAIIDGQITSVSNVLLDESFKETDDSNFNTQSYIGIVIPHFREYTLIDPDFSLLIDSRSASDIEDSKCAPTSKSGLTREQLIGVIVGSIVGGIIVTLVFIFIIYKRFLQYNGKVLSIMDKVKNLKNKN